MQIIKCIEFLQSPGNQETTQKLHSIGVMCEIVPKNLFFLICLAVRFGSLPKRGKFLSDKSELGINRQGKKIKSDRARSASFFLDHFIFFIFFVVMMATTLMIHPSSKDGAGGY